MPAAKELTVTTGWGQGRKAHFVGFAEGNGGLSAQHVGPTTTVITALPRKGDAIVEIDGERYACWFRNLDPFPARVVVVHENLCRLDLAQLDDVDSSAADRRPGRAVFARTTNRFVHGSSDWWPNTASSPGFIMATMWQSLWSA